MIKKISFIVLISFSNIHAELTSLDSSFINWNTDYIKSNSSGNNQQLTNTIINDVNSKIETNLKNDNLSANQYIKDLGDSFESGYDTYAIQTVTSEIDSLKNTYKGYENQLESIKQQVTNIIATQDLKSTVSSLQDISYSIDLGGDKGAIEVFNGDKYSQMANKTYSAKRSSIGGFNCACSSPLSSAFKNFDKHITDNINPIAQTTEKINTQLKDNIAELQKQEVTIDKEIAILKLKILETKQDIFTLNNQLELK